MARLSDAERQALSRKRRQRRETAAKRGWPDDGQPHRGAGPGNTLSVVHGATSGRLMRAAADVLKGEFLAQPWVPDYLRDPSYADKLDDYFYCRAQVNAYRAYVDAMPLAEQLEELEVIEEVAEGSPSEGLVQRRARIVRRMAAMKQLESLERRLDTSMSKLGLDPMSRARMGKDVAASQLDLARYFAEQDKAEREGLPPG